MIIRLKPIAIQKVWGGEKLSKLYNINQNKIGEIWGISAHLSNSNIIINGKYKGMTFRNLYNEHRDLFGNLKYDEFPILFKVIDAADDLSVQVHPDDTYAKENEDSLGKDECWYILDTESDNTEIIIGHNAKTKDELVNLINKNDYDKLLNRFKIKKDDYYYISSGKIHAICKGTTLLEVSQSSDITYRLYDYNRLDNGKLRELHVDKSIDVISAPDNEVLTNHINKHYSYQEIINNKEKVLQAHNNGDYIYIIEGTGKFNNENVKKGDFLVITSKTKYKIIGNFSYKLINLI